MFILDRRHFLAITGAAGAVGFAGPALARPGAADVFTSDAAGGNVDSVVVMGEQKAALIDAQFTVPNATALADMIAATGRELETIFISHFHPDHVLGLAVLMDRFPDAKPVAHAAIQPLIAETAEGMRAGMAANAPGAFADRVVIPDALATDHILLEGERLDILDPMHGDTDLIAGIHIPVLDTLITADMGFADTHVWVAENTTPERIDTWRTTLNTLEAIGASTVIPGHRSDTAANDASVFAYTRSYLDMWERALADTNTAEDLKAVMLEGRENMGLLFAVENAVKAVYPEG